MHQFVVQFSVREEDRELAEALLQGKLDHHFPDGRVSVSGWPRRAQTEGAIVSGVRGRPDLNEQAQRGREALAIQEAGDYAGGVAHLMEG